MELVLKQNEERSVEECMKELVKDLNPVARLQAAVHDVIKGCWNIDRDQ